jgi:hypothetical protein
MFANKQTQNIPFKFGNKLSIPLMSFGGKLNNIKNHKHNLHNNINDKPKHSDLEKHTSRLQNTHQFN